MTNSASNKHLASFSLTQSVEEIRSSCWIGFLSQHGTDGRVVREEGDLERDLKIRSTDADIGAIDIGLPCTSWTISLSPLALMTQVIDLTVNDWPGLGANGELGKLTICSAMGSSAHPYLAHQLSTKDAR